MYLLYTKAFGPTENTVIYECYPQK